MFKRIRWTKFKAFIIIFSGICLMLLLYKVKTELGFNIDENHSLSHTFPFKYLQKDNLIKNPQAGMVLENDFNGFFAVNPWGGGMWMRHQGDVSFDLDPAGYQDSQCLLIKNAGEGSFSFSQFKNIQVMQGDVFAFSVFIKTEGENTIAHAGFSTYDQNREAIDWNYFMKKMDVHNRWVLLNDTLKITDERIKFIHFRFTGLGPGQFRFDNAFVEKL